MDFNSCFFFGGGLLIRYFLLYPETRRFFRSYLIEKPNMLAELEIRVTAEYMEENRWLIDENETSLPFLEFEALMLKTGNELLSHNRALFHGAALLWRERAWILTAPSGTGKTTQLRHWRNILKREVKVINGDKPLLECTENGTILVHSSPWRGKERYGLPGISAPLGGIILLKQGRENQLQRLDVKEAVLPLFTEFISFPEDESQIACQAGILNWILDHVPAWEMKNLGDEASARLTQETIKRYLEEENHG